MLLVFSCCLKIKSVVRYSDIDYSCLLLGLADNLQNSLQELTIVSSTRANVFSNFSYSACNLFGATISDVIVPEFSHTFMCGILSLHFVWRRSLFQLETGVQIVHVVVTSTRPYKVRYWDLLRYSWYLFCGILYSLLGRTQRRGLFLVRLLNVFLRPSVCWQLCWCFFNLSCILCTDVCFLVFFCSLAFVWLLL